MRVIREGFQKEVTIEQSFKDYVGAIQAEHEEGLQSEQHMQRLRAIMRG